jgi:hypothetical protein
MINNHRLSAGLIVAALTSVLAGGSILPAAATELPLPPLHKAARVAMAAKKPAPRLHLVRIASITPLPSLVSGSRVAAFPIVLGVAF